MVVKKIPLLLTLGGAALLVAVFYQSRTPDSPRPEAVQPPDDVRSQWNETLESLNANRPEQVRAGPWGEQDTPEAREEALAQRDLWRQQRMAAYQEMPVADRAETLAQRWELTEDQKRELTEIMERYSGELAALEEAGMSGSELSRAQNDLMAKQRRDIMPIINQSPGMQRGKQRFIDAATARGGEPVSD